MATSPQKSGHLSIMATYLCPGGQYIQCFIFKPLDDGHLSKMAMAQQPVFSVTDGMEKSGMVMKFDLHGALMINHGDHILILCHLYCCSKYVLSKVNFYW